MNSEIWVCLTDKERCLPFVLVDHGYDVWVIHASLLRIIHDGILTVIAREQSWEQVLQEISPPFVKHSQVLGLLNGPVCYS